MADRGATAPPAGDGAGAAELFERVATPLVGEPGVDHGTGFGAMPGLRVGRRIFAMLCRGALVVKLPRHRVDELVAAGVAGRFDARNDGRLMKEWASIPVEQGHAWSALVAEALAFVGSTG